MPSVLHPSQLDWPQYNTLQYFFFHGAFFGSILVCNKSPDSGAEKVQRVLFSCSAVCQLFVSVHSTVQRSLHLFQCTVQCSVNHFSVHCSGSVRVWLPSLVVTIDWGGRALWLSLISSPPIGFNNLELSNHCTFHCQEWYGLQSFCANVLLLQNIPHTPSSVPDTLAPTFSKWVLLSWNLNWKHTLCESW